MNKTTRQLSMGLCEVLCNVPLMHLYVLFCKKWMVLLNEDMIYLVLEIYVDCCTQNFKSLTLVINYIRNNKYRIKEYLIKEYHCI